MSRLVSSLGSTPRRLSGLCAALGALLFSVLPSPAEAASPASGTLSQASPSVSWTGGPLTASAGGCAGPDDPTCHHFQLTIVPPPGGAGFTVRIG
jgi:hypothetical protein